MASRKEIAQDRALGKRPRNDVKRRLNIGGAADYFVLVSVPNPLSRPASLGWKRSDLEFNVNTSRSADTKARRRQWDAPRSGLRPIGRPPRYTRSPSGPPASPTTDPEIGRDLSSDAHHDSVRDGGVPHDSDDKVDAPATPAFSTKEVFALNVLAGMAAEARAGVDSATAPPLSDVILNDRDSDGIDPVLVMAVGSGSPVPSLSRHSSVVAVDDEPIRLPKRLVEDVYFDPREQPLPRNVAPPSLLQKRVRRQTGLFGPLTPVQRAQIFVADLAKSVVSDWSSDADERLAPTIPQLFMGSERLETVWEWRRSIQVDVDVGVEGDWDAEARWGFAEAALRRRVSL
ncbi:hypothetical protein C8R47DRAFT_1072486 [Mycena vitilis]|nr:hypothetical protein C8R47DRAFT_1072486 [Mycena vitilis]